MQKSAYLFFFTFFKNLIFFKSFFNNLSGKVSYIRGEKNGDSRLQSVCTQSDLYWNRWGNNGEYTGRIWHQYSDEPLSFQGTMEMVRSIENLFNQWNFPQSSTDSRSFSTKKPVAGEVQGKGVELRMDASRLHNKNGGKGTFVVHVRYRQNATWQGDVIWAEKNERQSFRSALELLKLIDSALDSKEGEELEND